MTAPTYPILCDIPGHNSGTLPTSRVLCDQIRTSLADYTAHRFSLSALTDYTSEDLSRHGDTPTLPAPCDVPKLPAVQLLSADLPRLFSTDLTTRLAP